MITMYELIRKYKPEFEIEVNDFLMENPYLISSIPKEMYKDITQDTIDHIILEVGLCKNLKVLVKEVPLTGEQYLNIIGKDYMDDEIFNMIFEKIFETENPKEYFKYILSRNYTGTRRAIEKWYSKMQDVLKLFTAYEILELRSVETIIENLENLDESTLLHDDLYHKLIRKYIDEGTLYKLTKNAAFWNFEFTAFDSFFDNYEFTTRFIEKTKIENIIIDDYYFFYEYLQQKFPETYSKIFESEFQKYGGNERINEYKLFLKHGDLKVMTDEEIAKAILEDRSFADISYIYMRAVQSPYIIKNMIENGHIDAWMFHFKKEGNEDIIDALVEFYFKNIGDYKATHILNEFVIPKYFENEKYKKLLVDAMNNEKKRKLIISDVHSNSVETVSVLLDAYPAFIDELGSGDLNKFLIKHMIHTDYY